MVASTLDFTEDLKQRYEACRWRGRLNYCAAYLFLILAVSSRAIATLSDAEKSAFHCAALSRWERPFFT
jgi:hypothetical protein